MTMTDDICFSHEKHIGLVTLNRINALNALTLPMISALQSQLQIWQDDNSIHAVVVRANGGRAFCAGGDVRAIYELGTQNHANQMDFFEHEYRLNRFIHHFKKPYIALMDGITMGGGVGISLHGSHPVASERFVFAMPETGIGFYPDIGASYLLSRCPGYGGIYLGLVGARLTGIESYQFGLVKHVIESSDHPFVLAALIDADLSVHPHEQVTKLLQSFSTFVPEEPNILHENIDFYFKYQNIESILSALVDGDNDWCKKTHQSLMQKSPLSLKVTYSQLDKARHMTLDACLAMDLGLTAHFMMGSDFYEGVRALLIDKDNTPHWQPSTLADISPEMVSAYFEPIAALC